METIELIILTVNPSYFINNFLFYILIQLKYKISYAFYFKGVNKIKYFIQYLIETI